MQKSTFKNRENTTVNAAIWCPAVRRISDVINEASVCSENVKHVMRQSFSAIRCQRTNQHGCLGELRFQAEKYFFCIPIDRTTK